MERISLKQVETSERFYRVPKALLLNPFYKDLKPESKLVYGILKDRLELSIRNNRVDEKGHVYLNFSIKSLEELLGFSNKKIIAIKKELKQFGLIEEERQGLNKSNRIYVGEVESEFEVIHRSKPMGDKEVNNLHIRKCKSDTSRCEESTLQEVNILHTNDTELSDTELSDTETNSLDEDEQNKKNSKQNSFQKIAEHISSHPELRDIFLEITPQNALNEPKAGLLIVEGLVQAENALEDGLKKGNSKMLENQIIFGDQVVIRQLKIVVQEQLDYMASHLVEPTAFGSYFKRGLKNRIVIWLETASLTNHLQ